MDETRKVARFVTDLQYNDLPQEVIAKAKELILDQLGCELGASTLPWSRAVYEYIRDKKAEKEESTVVKYGLRTSAEDCTFANATFGHGFEIDDADHESVLHAGCIVIPAALSTGEREAASGKEFITAVVVGYEVGMRIAGAVRLTIRRGFHRTPVSAPFAAAAVAGKMLALNGDEVLNAFGIAGSHSGGLHEYGETGGTVKRLHAGIAASGGVRSALLAQRGLTGPPTVLEGKRGLCQAFSDEYSIEEITRELGKQFIILRMGLKPYACCGSLHTTVDAISKIVAQHPFTPDGISEIRVVTKPASSGVAAIAEPKDILEMQLNGPFAVALTLLKGSNQFRDYTEENLMDPDIRNLARKVTLEFDPELEKVSKGTARVTVKLKDGTTYREQVDHPKGSIQHPLTKGELQSKFRGLASVVLPESKAEQIIGAVEGLERLDNIRQLATLLTAG